jgi:hypothetical protein
MSVEALSPAELGSADPNWSMGLELLAEQRRARLIQMAKVGIVWAALIAGLAFILLQLNVEPGYMVDHYGIVLQGLVTTIGISVISICIASTWPCSARWAGYHTIRSHVAWRGFTSRSFAARRC